MEEGQRTPLPKDSSYWEKTYMEVLYLFLNMEPKLVTLQIFFYLFCVCECVRARTRAKDQTQGLTDAREAVYH